jgi:transposase
MVKVGIDTHKKTHCAVAVDEVGRQLVQTTVAATDAGHLQLLRWTREQFPDQDVEFAVEDCRHVSTRLERALLAAGARVVRVPPKLMAGARASARTRGKSDPIDALAVARAALREPNLPVAGHDTASREIKLLVDHREDLVNSRTAMQNRLRWHLHEIDPELDPPAGSLARRGTLDELTEQLGRQPQDTVIVRIAIELLADIGDLSGRIQALEKELAQRLDQLGTRLLALPGCGVLTAAKIIGETANVSRFRSEACFAMHAGAAPVPASSGNTNRHRLARGGNRQLNAALHRIALTQIRLPGAGQDYYQRRRTSGDTAKKPCAHSNDASPAPCSTCSSPPTKPPPARSSRPLDIGATPAGRRPRTPTAPSP